MFFGRKMLVLRFSGRDMVEVFVGVSSERQNESLSRITIHSDICHGKPCIRGLRYPVEVILELLSAGMSYQELLDDYEDLEMEDIYAVLAFAAKLSQIKRVQFLDAA